MQSPVKCGYETFSNGDKIDYSKLYLFKREEIEWIIIEKHSKDIFLTTKYSIDVFWFNGNDSKRYYLNEFFYNNAFDETIKNSISRRKDINDNLDKVYLASKKNNTSSYIPTISTPSYISDYVIAKSSYNTGIAFDETDSNRDFKINPIIRLRYEVKE